MFRALCDETITFHGEPIVGVAAVLFDDRGYEDFHKSWKPKLELLDRPFSMSKCYGGHEEFGRKPWDADSRRNLWQGLGNLIVETRVATFFSFVTKADFKNHVLDRPNHRSATGDAYQFCLAHCAWMVADYSRKNGVKNIGYTFESGGPRSNEASQFWERVGKSSKVKNDLCYGGHAFLEKAIEPALYAPDYIAWGLQKTFAEGNKHWHETIEIVRSDKTHPMYVTQISEGSVFQHLLYNTFYNLSQD